MPCLTRERLRPPNRRRAASRAVAGDDGLAAVEAIPTARLGVVLALDEPAVLVLQRVVLPRAEVRRGGVGAVGAELVGAERAGRAALDGPVWLDGRLLVQRVTTDGSRCLQDVLDLPVGLQVRANRQRRVVQAVHLVEVVEPPVPLLLVRDLRQDPLEGREERLRGGHVWVRLRLQQLLAEGGGAAHRGVVERRHPVRRVLVVDIGILLEHAVQPLVALAPSADDVELRVRGQLLADDGLSPGLRHDERHGGL
mmetsp:Transcript_92433/g.258319  ORF Transcript_92433/g.258319 Transcript_92433/m.258319 type:complete len:253 (+) Transcript_92433:24-782(+)